jgi:beta-glucosidase
VAALTVVAVVVVGTSVGAMGAPPPGNIRTVAGEDSTPNCPWLNSAESVRTRVAQLEHAATSTELAETMELLGGNKAGDPHYEGVVPAIPALCMPPIVEQDGDVGVAGASGVWDADTKLPSEISLAATFDPPLAMAYGSVIGHQANAQGIDFVMAPMINIMRSSNWGRAYETLGEDPYLTTSMAVADVKGIQRAGEPTILKHWIAYSQETNRQDPTNDDAIVSAQALHEVYMPPFEQTIADDQPAGVMCAMNDLNGVPACADENTIDGVLRHQWSYHGFVRTDCQGANGTTSASNRAIVFKAGVSQSKCGGLYPAAVVAATWPKTEIESVVAPYLTQLFRYNLVAAPRLGTPGTADDEATGEATALKVSEEGSVMLKDADDVLPLNTTNLGTVALIGAMGGSPDISGGGSSLVHASATYPTVTLRSALSPVLGSDLDYVSAVNSTTPDSAERLAAVQAARRAAVAIVVVSLTSGEGHDVSSLALPVQENDLVEQVAQANPDTIVVVESGAAVLMPWRRDPGVKAIFMQWYPGQVAGLAMSDLLLGVANPSGRLPVNIPESDQAQPDPIGPRFGTGVPATVDGEPGHDILYQEGVDVGYRWYDANGVPSAYAFGAGLSYSRFAFSDIDAARAIDGGVNVTADVTNVSGVPGTEVAQLYMAQPQPESTTDAEPPIELRGFARVNLQPGETRPVTFAVSPGDLAHWDTSTHSWQIFGGAYTFSVGGSSAHLALQATIDERSADLGVLSGLTAQT